jgi:hypothetical protein
VSGTTADVAAELGEESSCQLGDVGAATVAERWKPDRENCESIEEVFAEPAGAEMPLEVPIGGGNESDIHFDLARAAEPPETATLEDVEQLGLQLGDQVADFVEEDGAGVGQLEKPAFGLAIVREGTFFVSEDLGMEKTRAEACAADFDERCGCAGGEGVNQMRDPSLAGTCLTDEQDRSIASGEKFDLAGDFSHGERRAESLEPGGLGVERREESTSATQLDLLDGALGSGVQMFQLDRLREEVLGAPPHGFDGRRNVGFAREHDDGGIRIGAAELLEEVEPAHAG